MADGWQDSNRKASLPSNWGTLRKRVLERDGERCTWVTDLGGQRFRCHAKATEVDHAGDREDHRLESLRSLCHDHHAQRTQSQSWEARRKNVAKAKKKFRRKEEHPGLAYMKQR